MSVTLAQLGQTHEIVDRLVGQATLSLHKQGRPIHQNNLAEVLTSWRDGERDETRRFFLQVAIGLISV